MLLGHHLAWTRPSHMSALSAIWITLLLSLSASCLMAGEVIRIMAANITSGTNQSYDPGEGNRIFQALAPDIAMVQEMNYLSDSPTNFRSWVTENFGASFSYFREPGNGIPNGIVSRYPILASGEWDDTTLTDRDFAWAKIDIPGDKNLWVISVHLKASSGSTNSNQRNTQAGQILSYITAANIPSTDYMVIGGDFNTYSRTEACIDTLSSTFVTGSPWPADQSNNDNTNAGRSEPYDWVIPDNELNALKTPLIVGSKTYTNGLVFDSRVYKPLSDVSPVLATDSGATGMQHMAVIRAFNIPSSNTAPVISQGSTANVTLSKNNTPTPFSLSLSATDADSTTLTWSISSAAGHGTASVKTPVTGTTVSLNYTPTTGYVGSDVFSVLVSDGSGGTDSITVNLTIAQPPNTAPVIDAPLNEYQTISQNNFPTPFSLSLTASDGNSDPLTWSISTPAIHGTASIKAPNTGETVSITYQPVKNYLGTDSFMIKVSDGLGGFDEINILTDVQPASAYDVWTFDYFSPIAAESQNSIWGDHADPDADGRNNLMEFALGLDPTKPDASTNLVSILPEPLGTNSFSLSFKMKMDGIIPALDYGIQSSTDLSTGWIDLPATDFTLINDTDGGEGFTLRTLRLNQTAGISKRFFRITIRR